MSKALLRVHTKNIEKGTHMKWILSAFVILIYMYKTQFNNNQMRTLLYSQEYTYISVNNIAPTFGLYSISLFKK